MLRTRQAYHGRSSHNAGPDIEVPAGTAFRYLGWDADIAMMTGRWMFEGTRLEGDHAGECVRLLRYDFEYGGKPFPVVADYHDLVLEPCTLPHRSTPTNPEVIRIRTDMPASRSHVLLPPLTLTAGSTVRRIGERGDPDSCWSWEVTVLDGPLAGQCLHLPAVTRAPTGRGHD